MRSTLTTTAWFPCPKSTAHGSASTAAHAKWLAKNHVGPAEWHHSSKVFNPTDFYSPDSMKSYIEENGDRAEDFSASKSAPVDAPRPAVASWDEWVGSGRRAKKVSFKDVPGHVSGNWFHHEGGKKSVEGRHIRVTFPDTGPQKKRYVRPRLLPE